jgi:hypothetical protein
LGTRIFRPLRSAGVVIGRLDVRLRGPREEGQRLELGLLLDIVGDLLADGAIHDFVEMVEIADRIGHGQQRGARRPVLQRFPGDREIDGAELDAFDQIGFLAQLLVGEDPDLDRAVRARGDLLGEFKRCLVPDIVLIAQMAELQRRLRLGADRRSEPETQGRAQAKPQTSGNGAAGNRGFQRHGCLSSCTRATAGIARFLSVFRISAPGPVQSPKVS